MANKKVTKDSDYYTPFGYAGVSQDEIDAVLNYKGNLSNINISQHNAEDIAAHEIFGVSRLTALTVVVDGNKVPYYKHFKLKQSAVKHHRFSCVLDYDALGMEENQQMEASQKLLGKRFTVIFSYRDIEKNAPKRSFTGVITHVGFTREKRGKGHIVLEGGDPTVLLDAAPHLQSFGGNSAISLKSIALEVLKILGADYAYQVEVSYTGNVPYSCQYEETHYNYLARLAAEYGENFYYDGDTVQFGKRQPETALKLVYGKEVDNINIALKTRHVNRTMYGYNSSRDKYLNAINTPLQHVSSLAKAAYGISEKTYKAPSVQAAPVRAVVEQDVDAAQRSVTGSEGIKVLTVSGETKMPFLYPGCVVDMYVLKADSAEISYLTRLVIVKIKHEVDELGNYKGKFEAAASDMDFLPRAKFKEVIAKPQFAKVVSNADPLGQGRVQVKFP